MVGMVVGCSLMVERPKVVGLVMMRRKASASGCTARSEAFHFDGGCVMLGQTRVGVGRGPPYLLPATEGVPMARHRRVLRAGGEHPSWSW